MENERRSDFCTSCRRETSYKMRKKIVPKVIKDKTYEFEIAVAVCEECGKEMDIPGLLDTNIKSIDEQYRQAEGVINVGDIQKLMQEEKFNRDMLLMVDERQDAKLIYKNSRSIPVIH